MDDHCMTMAEAAGGVFSRVEALRWGMSDNDLTRLVRAGRLTRPRRGVYALPTSGGNREEEHAYRVRAILRGRPASCAAARSTLALAQLPLVRADLSTVLLCGAGKERFRRGDVVTYPLPSGEKGITIGGAPSVSIETAIFQTVARDGLTTAIVAADAALHRGLVTPESLEHRRVGLRRLAPRGRQLMESVDGASESPGESLMRLILVGLGHDVQIQVVITTPDGEFVARVDALVDDWIVMEFDGAGKYGDADGRDALIREKRREDALRALGYIVVRVTWRDLFTPGRVAALVRAAQAQLRARSATPRAAAR